MRPIYPPDAMAAKVTGVVAIEALIDPTGRSVTLRVIESIPELDQAALDAVGQWEFTPTLLNGVPQPVFITITVIFTLEVTRTLTKVAPHLRLQRSRARVSEY
jgi:TonB family protein